MVSLATERIFRVLKSFRHEAIELSNGALLSTANLFASAKLDGSIFDQQWQAGTLSSTFKNDKPGSSRAPGSIEGWYKQP